MQSFPAHRIAASCCAFRIFQPCVRSFSIRVVSRSVSRSSTCDGCAFAQIFAPCLVQRFEESHGLPWMQWPTVWIEQAALVSGYADPLGDLLA